jgi:N-methylhydantoinase B
MANKTSAVELQVMWNRLIAVVDEQAQALMHTAFSPIVRESGDISAGVFDSALSFEKAATSPPAFSTSTATCWRRR